MRPKYTEKLTEKAFARMIITSIVGILLCVGCLCSATWAWFTGNVSSQDNSISSATLELSVSAVQIVPEGGTPSEPILLTPDPNSPETPALINASGETVSYTVTLSLPKGSASGFCRIDVYETPVTGTLNTGNGVETLVSQVYYTDTIKSHSNDTPETLSFTAVLAPYTKVTFTPLWGVSSASELLKVEANEKIVLSGATSIVPTTQNPTFETALTDLPAASIATNESSSASLLPYAYIDTSLFAGKAITKLGIPVKTVTALDENQTFTLSVVSTQANVYSYINQYVLTLPLDQLTAAADPVSAADEGAANTPVEINDWIYLDLSKYNIILKSGETLAFGASTDTVTFALSGTTNAAYAYRNAHTTWENTPIENGGVAASNTSAGLIFDVYTTEKLEFTETADGWTVTTEEPVLPSVKQELPGGDISSSSSVQISTAPYLYLDTTLFTGKTLSKIGIPVKSVEVLNASQTFTLSVVDPMTNTVKRSYQLKLPVNQLGNTTTLNRWVYVDLSELNITVGEGETLAFGASDDTVTWGWISGSSAGDLYRFRQLGNANESSCGIFFDVYAKKTLSYIDYLEALAEARMEAERMNALKELLADKKVSILGDSISTFEGYSNNTSYNTTIGSNAVYYNGTNYITDVNETWWMQLITETGTTLLVNNSYSGDMVTGNGVSRATELDNTEDVVPELIFVYLGINDFDQNVSVEDFKTAYSSMIEKMVGAVGETEETGKYPNADIFLFTLVPNNANSRTIAELEAFNAAIRTVGATYGCTVVDLYADSGITADTMTKYMGDAQALHPNAAGMDLITACVIDTLLTKYVGN